MILVIDLRSIAVAVNNIAITSVTSTIGPLALALATACVFGVQECWTQAHMAETRKAILTAASSTGTGVITPK